jgi:transcriptional regulator with GAF, ATPase, and Fis domain/pSer/pThr/pTyr-binding forkhead associated (FHA) protein
LEVLGELAEETLWALKSPSLACRIAALSFQIAFGSHSVARSLGARMLASFSHRFLLKGAVSVRTLATVVAHPYLTAIKGPLQGSVLPIRESVSIGRESSNAVCLPDAAISPRHCRITSDSERYILEELDGAASTIVNGIPVKRRVLSHGDIISVGDSSFLFLEDGGSASTSSPVHLDENAALSVSAEQVRQDELRFLNPEKLAALPAQERIARTLGTLLKISTAIGSLGDVDSVQWQLLGTIFDVIPAERAAILLCGDTLGEFASTVAWDCVSGPDQPVHVSRSLALRVIGERVSILDPAGDSQPPESAALSLLCVPLSAGDRVLGVIYLDTRNPSTRFRTEDLQLLSAIAGLAAVAIENARQFERLGSENQRLRAEVNLRHDMVGQGPRMREVYQFIEKVAPSDSTVLIHGESGTGKELAARAIHQNSPRKSQPFVALNCAALTEALLESELFGHERGAFTSAVVQKKGMLEVADGGTVFLDEVGELPLTLQAKLLRVLQEREFVRVGGTRSIKVNVRFVAATNRDLQKAVKEDKFRLDLFYRLNVVSVTMPALRDHAEDIPALAEYFVGKFAERGGRRLNGISAAARGCLARYDWPGNVRELENAVERAVVVGSSDVILPEDLPEALAETAAVDPCGSAKYHDAILHLKRQLILSAFDQAGGSFTEAAKLLGVHPNYLHRLVRNLDLRMSLKNAG